MGCVLVHNNQVVGRGMNATNATYNGTRHAEFMAINDVLTMPKGTQNSSVTKQTNTRYGPEVLKECDLYVTVEPCIMCASLLRQFGIRKVYFGASNEKFGGTGGVLNIYLANGCEPSAFATASEEDQIRVKADDYEVSGGWLREEAIVLLRRFYIQENERAPEPRGKKDRVLNLEVEPLPSVVTEKRSE